MSIKPIVRAAGSTGIIKPDLDEAINICDRLITVMENITGNYTEMVRWTCGASEVQPGDNPTAVDVLAPLFTQRTPETQRLLEDLTERARTQLRDVRLAAESVTGLSLYVVEKGLAAMRLEREGDS